MFVSLFLFLFSLTTLWASGCAFAGPPGSMPNQNQTIVFRGLEGLSEEAQTRALRHLNTAAEREGFDLLLYNDPHGDYQLWGEVDASRQADPNKIFYAWVVYNRHGQLAGVGSGFFFAKGKAEKGRSISDAALQIIAKAAIEAVKMNKEHPVPETKATR
jgi:hypothetical protein